MTDQKLMDYFKFDESDLQANRNGKFSAKQKERIFGRHLSAVREKRIAAAILIPLSTLMLFWMFYLIFEDGMRGAASDLGAIVMLGLFGGVLLLAGAYILRISFIGPTYLLKKAEGPVNIVKESKVVDNVRYVNYELHVGGETFNLHDDSGAADVMMQGNPYIVYYSQGAENNLKEILSAELISKGK